VVVVVTSRWIQRVHRHGLGVTLAAGAWGIAIIGFGLAPMLWLALLCLVLAGAADEISAMFRGTMWNQTIPDRLRGRLAGVEMLSYSVGPTLGNLESGVAARFVGVGGSVVLGGVLCVVGTVALAAVLPAFVRYDGRDGLARKVAEDEEWAAQAAAAGPNVGEPSVREPGVGELLPEAS
jgi:MFS family permease